jgi:hypothetical protein
MYDISKPVITGEFSGVAMPVSLSLTLNGEVVVAEVSGNEFTYTPAEYTGSVSSDSCASCGSNV